MCSDLAGGSADLCLPDLYGVLSDRCHLPLLHSARDQKQDVRGDQPELRQTEQSLQRQTQPGDGGRAVNQANIWRGDQRDTQQCYRDGELVLASYQVFLSSCTNIHHGVCAFILKMNEMLSLMQ